MKKIVLSVAAGLALLTASATAQEKAIKIGFVSTFSGPTAAIGNDMRNSFELALDHLGRKMYGLPVRVIYEDDQQKPEVGRQKTQKLVESDKVDFVAGYIWSNVLLASVKPVLDADAFLISAQAGPSSLAGPQCSKNLFLSASQNEQHPEAMGEYMNRKGIKSVFLIGPNYAAGHDSLSGVKRTFKGKIVDEVYTKWPDQLDFSAELSRARAAKPDAIFAFYPGAAGVQFLKQYTQSGLKGQIPLYTVATIDEISLPLQKENALGVLGMQQWANDIPNEQNKKFVADYRAKYPGLRPTYFGAFSYDIVGLINSAIVAVKGDLTNKDGIRNALHKADFKSVRGPFKFGNNNVPIENEYLLEVVKDNSGELSLKTVDVLKDRHDSYASQCPLTW